MIGFKQCPYPYDRYAINEYDLALDLKTGEVIVPCIVLCNSFKSETGRDMFSGP